MNWTHRHFCFLATVLCQGTDYCSTVEASKIRHNSSVKRNIETRQGGRFLSIEDFGAIPDGKQRNWDFQNFLDEQLSVDNYFPDGDNLFTAKWDVDLAINNTNAFNRAIESAESGDVINVPDGKTFSFTGGILVYEKQDITIDFAGSSHFIPVRNIWPFDTAPESSFDGKRRYSPAIAVHNCTNVHLTSSSLMRARVKVDFQKNIVHLVKPYKFFGGIINGNGKMWWDAVIKKKHSDRRPRLIHIMESGDILVENLTLINSPYWTFTIEGIDSEIRNINILVDRKYQSDPPNLGNVSSSSGNISTPLLDSYGIPFPIDDLPDWIGRKLHQPQDLNTDGIDPIGQNIWVHDCIIQNADDSVAVKPSHGGRNNSRIGDCTQNITVENMILTGFGASVGSVPPHDFHRCVDDVTFRNITMPGTGKGIYVKSDWGNQACENQTGQITNILYEDIFMSEPFWWPIWVGPQQQHQPHTKLDLKCGLTWPIEPDCPAPGCIQMENITLRNVEIKKPVISPAVILGNDSQPITNIIIENLRVSESKNKVWLGKWPFHESHYPWHGRIKCENANGWFSNSHPKPKCLKQKTNQSLLRSTIE